MELVKGSRKFMRKLVTETHNKKDEFSSKSQIELIQTKKTLTERNETLTLLNDKFQSLKFASDIVETELDSELSKCEEYSEKVRDCLTLLDSLITAGTSNTSAGNSNVTVLNNQNKSLLKSPVCPLPKFESKEGEDLTKFLQNLEDVLSKYNYPDYEKYLLLKQQVSGRALTLINSLSVKEQAFDKAKSLLEKAFASPEIRKFNTIKDLVNLKLNNSDDPYDYFSKISCLIDNVNSLKIASSDFLQYFCWNGLNSNFQSHLIQITNNSKPPLEEIVDNFFEACNRYKVIKSKTVNSETVSTDATSLATKVSTSTPNKTFKCSLCKREGKDDNHPLFKCNVFFDSELKVNKLKALNGCLKCGVLSHVTDSCNYKLRSRCKHCSQWHMSYLCLKVSKPNDDNFKEKTKNVPPKSETKKTESKTKNVKESVQETNSKITVITEALRTSDCDSQSILPTFTSVVNNVNIRILKDGGCQNNLINDKLANDLNLVTIKDSVKLTVKGINSHKTFHTREVEVNLQLGDRNEKISALCIPEIDISLKLPNLNKVVSGFVNKGYNLADKFLLDDRSNEISNINFILGTKSSYVVPDHEILFGCTKQSLYSDTPIGVMLKGDINSLLRDLESLPNLVNSNESNFYDNDCFVSNISPFNENSCFSVNLAESFDVPKQNCVSILDNDGNVLDHELDKAVADILENQNFPQTKFDEYDDSNYEINNQLVDYVISNTVRLSDGRLEMPLLWNPQCSHLLGHNFGLAKAILNSLKLKMSNNKDRLIQINDVFKQQEETGIIEKINNVEDFMQEHPNYSFLPYMGIFKPERETTKTRIVFLSNLCQNDREKPITFSHNQCIYPGPNLNPKLASALLNLRFGEKMLIFDIRKAFNQISLNEIDQNRLLFLWYRNIHKNDFSLVGFRNKRLSFGLRCSPTILMLALHKILILDSHSDSDELTELKSLIYSLAYMDNLAYTTDSSERLNWAYNEIPKIFSPYCFDLQQFESNDQCLNDRIFSSNETVNESSIKKLLGMQWDRENDTISTKPINLNINANTKRSILSSIASEFDLFNFNGPLLNRSRIFMHKLQCDRKLSWDEVLSNEFLNEWKNIVKQCNMSEPVNIDRCLGSRNDPYRIIGFADSSKELYGSVLYIQNMNTNKVGFILSKNRFVNKSLETKSIPALEVQALALTTECCVELKNELSGPTCVRKIDIKEVVVYSDSMCALTWLNSAYYKLDKMQKKSIFVLNRLDKIKKLCDSCPVKFSFVSGTVNPADFVTRPISFKKLKNTNFYTGPDFLTDSSNLQLSNSECFELVLPNPNLHNDSLKTGVFSVKTDLTDEIVPVNKFSSFNKLVAVHQRVFVFANKLKIKLKLKNPVKYSHFVTKEINYDFYLESVNMVILNDQLRYFPEVFEFFARKSNKIKDIPNIVSQLNLYIDTNGLIRVKSKCDKLKDIKKFGRFSFPLLIHKDSPLSKLIIYNLHEKLFHAGYFATIAEIKKRFWIPKIFSLVKKCLSSCVTCKRFNERTVKINQSPYRDFRIEPSTVPFQNIYIDHIGPFYVNPGKTKVWLLCVTCLFTRAVNLIICNNFSTAEFLRALQIHSFKYGLPSLCFSDLGTQLVAGTEIIATFLNDHETVKYLNESGISKVNFDQYYKGHSELGSLVEVMVKFTKKLLYGSMGRNVLDFKEFEFIVIKTNHLINRRPIAFKQALTDTSGNYVPDPITPEMLIHGRELVSLNLIPDLHPVSDEWKPETIKDSFLKLRKVREKLVQTYHDEFLSNLIYQAVDKKDRYKPNPHKTLDPGDLVLVKDPNTKQINYPLGMIKNVIKNDLDEVTNVDVIKGRTKEVLKRHVTSVIPLLKIDRNFIDLPDTNSKDNQDDKLHRPLRQAAVLCNNRLKQIFKN